MAKNKPNLCLFGTIFAFLVFGIVILASVSAPVSMEKFGNPYYYLTHQIFYGILPGLILGFLAYRIDLSILKKWLPFLLLFNLILLGLVFLPGIGLKAWGASRWLAIGPISFQPSEFLKLTFILYIASWIAARTEKNLPRAEIRFLARNFSQTFFVFLAVLGLVSLFLILQPDITTLGIIVAATILMYFLAETPLWHTFFIFLLGSGALFALIKLAPYRLNRLLVFLNPEQDPMGKGYQIKQALISIGSGGVFGQGLGMSEMRFSFLPQPMADSIFAVFATETGFLGSLFLIMLFAFFLWFSFKIAKSTRGKFQKLAVLGIASWISLQGFVNISSMLGILPISGVPLPFISYGGSAMIAELIGAGILLNISRNKN